MKNDRVVEFIDSLKSVQLPNVFNPYTDQCPVHDLVGAPSRRSAVLSDILKAAVSRDVHSIWIGRDLGYRGGRRTGLALTDDVHVASHGERWSLPDVTTATVSGDIAERTATVIWNALDKIQENVFLWNVFPFHPHKPAQPFTNRMHSSSERQIGEKILTHLITILRPRYLVPIGKDAATTASRLHGSENVISVRHPSYGGQTDFRRQIEEFYGVHRQ